METMLPPRNLARPPTTMRQGSKETHHQKARLPPRALRKATIKGGKASKMEIDTAFTKELTQEFNKIPYKKFNKY